MEGRNNSRIPHSYPSGGLIGNLRSRIVSFLVSGYGVHQLTYLQHHLFLLSMCWRTSVLKCRSDKFPARDKFGSCTRYPRGLTRWAEFLGRRRRRRQLVSPGGYRPPDPPAHLARGRVVRMLGLIPECFVFQYFQIQILTD